MESSGHTSNPCAYTKKIPVNDLDTNAIHVIAFCLHASIWQRSNLRSEGYVVCQRPVHRHQTLDPHCCRPLCSCLLLLRRETLARSSCSCLLLLRRQTPARPPCSCLLLLWRQTLDVCWEREKWEKWVENFQETCCLLAARENAASDERLFECNHARRR